MAKGVQGLDKLMRKYGQLAEQVAQDTMEKAVGASTKKIQAEAKTHCPFRSEGGGGALKESIKTYIGQQDDKIIGVVYTDIRYAHFVEFGTGPRGETNHAGISPVIDPAYTQSPWWIKEGTEKDQIGREKAEMYGWFYIDTKEGRFYQCNGQPAHPFMYPALKDNEERVTRNISNYLAREIKKVCEQ